jgi:hypothetical protein
VARPRKGSVQSLKTNKMMRQNRKKRKQEMDKQTKYESKKSK